MKQGIIDGGGTYIEEPDALDMQKKAYVKAFFPQLMQDMPPEGRDLMLQTDIQSSAGTKLVMDWLAFMFIKETGGTVERGQTVAEGKIQYMAIFQPPTTN